MLCVFSYCSPISTKSFYVQGSRKQIQSVALGKWHLYYRPDKWFCEPKMSWCIFCLILPYDVMSWPSGDFDNFSCSVLVFYSDSFILMKKSPKLLHIHLRVSDYSQCLKVLDRNCRKRVQMHRKVVGSIV